jgi:hypothetical protein
MMSEVSTMERIDFVETDIFELQNTVHKQMMIISDLMERVKALQDSLYDIAPELEIIDTMADSEEERKELISRYINRNEEYCGIS